MNKKYLFLSIFLVIAIILLIFIFSNRLPMFRPETSIETCDNFNYTETKVICYAFLSGNPEYCKFVNNFNSECIQFSVIKGISKDFCENVTDPYTKTWCFSNLAVKNKDPSICDKNINDSRFLESCFNNVPFMYYELHDESYCRSIIDESSRDACLGIVKKDLTYCENLTIEPYEKDICQSIILRNSSLCWNEGLCYENMAILEKNSTLCNLIGGQWGIAECVGIVSKDVKKCDDMDGTIAKDLCKLYAFKSIEFDIK